MKTSFVSLLAISFITLSACAGSDTSKSAQVNEEKDATAIAERDAASEHDASSERDAAMDSSTLADQDMNYPDAVDDALAQDNSALSQELRNSLSHMGNEERLAYDVYNALYEIHGTRQFTNIATNSEYKHIQAVQDLINKYELNDGKSFSNIDMPPLGLHDKTIEEMPVGVYDIAKIQKLYDDLVAMGSTTEIDGLKVGCIIEVVDIIDLDEYIQLAVDSNAPDVEAVFQFLRDGSYNHYWSFDNGLKKKGIADGCCALGVIDGTDYCHLEYPKK